MDHPVDQHVGHRIRLRRRILGKTQKDLAAAVGIKFQQIQKYETGTNRVSASRLWEIAHTLDVPVAYFFDGLRDDTSGDPSPEYDERETTDLLRAYFRIPATQRRKLLDLARAMGDDD